jgi:hypothetical protein
MRLHKVHGAATPQICGGALRDALKDPVDQQVDYTEEQHRRRDG